MRTLKCHPVSLITPRLWIKFSATSASIFLTLPLQAQIYPSGRWDRCGKNLHPTATSTYCVSVPEELEKGSFGYMQARHDIKGYAGRDICTIRKGEYVVLLPPGGVEEGVRKYLFASKDGCIAKLRFQFLK